MVTEQALNTKWAEKHDCTVADCTVPDCTVAQTWATEICCNCDCNHDYTNFGNAIEYNYVAFLSNITEYESTKMSTITPEYEYSISDILDISH